MQFSVHGPFELPRQSSLIDNSAAAKKAFWKAVDAKVPNLSGACGAYVFVVKARRGGLPWYVGLTTKKTFKDEALGPFQINHYNPPLAGKVGVKAHIFFIAKRTPTKRFARPSRNSHADIEFLEIFLFGIALNRNGSLRNAKNTRFLKNICVPGIINSPPRPPYKDERELKSILGL